MNVPAVNETVKTKGPTPESAAVPAAPDAGAVNVRAAVPEFARARPAPVSVMMILPLLATVTTGVSATLMVTKAAPLATLLKVMMGALVPRLLPIAPDATDAEAVISTLVCTVTLPPAVAAPMVRPASVTVTAVLAASVAPAVVMTMEVVPGAAMGPREAPPDTTPLGVAVVAKKLMG